MDIAGNMDIVGLLIPIGIYGMLGLGMLGLCCLLGAGLGIWYIKVYGRDNDRCRYNTPRRRT
eukprot:13519009-Alexandrium_andersonii.AAC.1